MRLAALVALGSVFVVASLALAGRPSSVVYGPLRGKSTFSHAAHAARGASCESCHATAATSRRATDDLNPTVERCRVCHRQPDFVALVPAAADRQVIFSHAAHAQKGITCQRCHLGAAEIDAGRALPAMRDCQTCHDAQKQPLHAERRCTTCHLAGGDQILTTHLPTGLLVPLGTGDRDDAHTPAFRTQHRAAASANREACAACHRQDFCQGCHVGVVKPLDFHGNDFLTRHPLDARRADSRCQSCHRPQTFCIGCHERSGVGGGLPGPSFAPGGANAFHPSGFAAEHGREAKRNLRTCASCHREDSCQACHSTASGGKMQVSPHGAGWRGSARCQSLVDRNPRVCLRCHDDAVTCR